MAVTITMPKLGLTMNSGSVTEWKKQIGESVTKGEILYVVATDKLTVDVESPADGVLLAITIKPGEEVPVGEAIGAIGEPGEKVEGCDRRFCVLCQHHCLKACAAAQIGNFRFV